MMAPVHNFRHVEVDNIGRGKRIVKPPGGECSDIFGVSESPEPRAQSTPRKSNNYMQSTIFSPNGNSPSNGHHSSINTKTPGNKHDDTRGRLFGDTSLDEDNSPRKIVDRQKSNIFEDEVDSGIFSPKNTPVRRQSINPITGTPIGKNGVSNGDNGHSNITNGFSNGDSSPDSPTNGAIRMRMPPGGPSSGIF